MPRVCAMWLCDLLLVVACTAAPTPTTRTVTETVPPTAAPAPTSPPTPAVESLVVSYSNLVPDNLPLWVTKEAGIFDQHGLSVGLKLIASSTGIPALLAGETNVFTGGGSETLSADAGGADLVLIGNFIPVYPFLFEVPPDITTIDQLRGKKVGVSSIGSSSDIASRAGLRRAGLDPESDVTFVPWARRRTWWPGC